MTLGIRRRSAFGTDAAISPDAKIGANTIIGANVVIGPNVTIGSNCVIKPGAVIGTDGFGYKYDDVRGWVPKDHPYGVVIGNHVHIGANTVIDRGSGRPTRIERGARIDNLVHIAHNVQIGQRAVVVALAELSGSVVVMRRAWIGPRACVKEHVTIGSRALVGIGAVVLKDVPADQTWVGNPAYCFDETVGVRDVM